MDHRKPALARCAAFTLALAAAASAPLGLLAVAARPAAGEPMLAVYPPWTSAASTLSRVAGAEAALVRMAGENLAVVRGDAAAARRLRDGGAWLVIAARGRLCGDRDAAPERKA